jgi:tetratricopeptide (TPR) repeat protein
MIMFVFSSTAIAQKENNTELQKMYDADQFARSAGSKIDWLLLFEQDSVRKMRVYEMVREGKVITAKDHYNAAVIFQHGGDSAAFGMAVKHIRKAIELDSTVNKWLLAAAIDRHLMSRGKPQIYGTQYWKNPNGKWARYRIDTTQVTDTERKYYHVPTIAEQKIKERNMNLLSVATYYSSSNSIDKTLQVIKAEVKKGDTADYNVSETALNSFGFELINKAAYKEALKILKLNTKLYSGSYKTFDSYGEILLKLNKKREALKAYRQSLQLNPKNDNAEKILAANK